MRSVLLYSGACDSQLKEHPERGVYVRDLSMHSVHSVAECERIIEQGWRKRAVGYTLMNKDSSRSHSIFTIHLEICSTGSCSYHQHVLIFTSSLLFDLNDDVQDDKQHQAVLTPQRIAPCSE